MTCVYHSANAAKIGRSIAPASCPSDSIPPPRVGCPSFTSCSSSFSQPDKPHCVSPAMPEEQDPAQSASSKSPSWQRPSDRTPAYTHCNNPDAEAPDDNQGQGIFLIPYLAKRSLSIASESSLTFAFSLPATTGSGSITARIHSSVVRYRPPTFTTCSRPDLIHRPTVFRETRNRQAASAIVMSGSRLLMVGENVSTMSHHVNSCFIDLF